MNPPKPNFLFTRKRNSLGVLWELGLGDEETAGFEVFNRRRCFFSCACVVSSSYSFFARGKTEREELSKGFGGKWPLLAPRAIPAEKENQFLWPYFKVKHLLEIVTILMRHFCTDFHPLWGTARLHCTNQQKKWRNLERRDKNKCSN